MGEEGAVCGIEKLEGMGVHVDQVTVWVQAREGRIWKKCCKMMLDRHLRLDCGESMAPEKTNAKGREGQRLCGAADGSARWQATTARFTGEERRQV